jgi:hypothetical protein
MRTLVLLSLMLLSLAGRAEDYIAVNASGWVEAVPDRLDLSVSVRATGKDVEALQREVDATTRQLAAAALELGIAEEDIDTARLSVRPDYEWRDGERRYRGQTVQREVGLTLRALDRYGELVAALSRFDIDTLGPPRLGHSNLDALRLEAMDRALEQGFAKARRIASGIGAELGEVLRVEEQGAAPPSPMPRVAAAESMNTGAPDVQFGKQRITAAVSMRFAIN